CSGGGRVGTTGGAVAIFCGRQMRRAVVALAAFATAALAGAAAAQSANSIDRFSLAPSQLVNPADLTKDEADFYGTLKDPDEARAFIVTRSYVRLCQAVIDKKSPAAGLPPRPSAFKVAYMLPGEAEMINDAIGESVVARWTAK